MKVIPHPGMPHINKMVRIEERDMIALKRLIDYAFEHGAVRGQQGPYQRIWLQFGEHPPVSYHVKCLRGHDVYGAVIDLERGIHLPTEEEARQ